MLEDATYDGREEPVLLSALNQYLYCDRRCALIHVEGVFTENAFTVEGSLRHEAVDTPGYEAQPGARVVRGLAVYSDRLGLSGKADIVEFHGAVPYPVEYKRGKRRQWDNDDVQLCAQGLCLEETFGIRVPRGAVFHWGSRRRREVTFTEELRRKTLETIAAVRELIASQRLPPARLGPRCEGCSLRGVCLPELGPAGMSRAAVALFRVED